MKRKLLALVLAISVLLPVICGCAKTIVVTQTEILTVPGPVMIQTVSVSGPVTTTTQITTALGQVATTTQTTTTAITVTMPGLITTVTPISTSTPTATSNPGVTNITCTPASPSTLHFNEKVTVTFDYVIADPLGGQIWAMAYTNGTYTPNSYYQASSVLPTGKGTISRYFFVGSGSVKVDQIYIVMYDSARRTVFQTFIPVDYSYIP